MAQLFQLPCSCGKFALVRAAQAGNPVQCECGQTLVVPETRALRNLVSAGEDTAANDSVDPQISGLRLAFVAVAAIAIVTWFTAGYFALDLSQIPEGLPFDEVVRQDAAHVDELAADEIFAEFRKVTTMGLTKGEVPLVVAIHEQRKLVAASLKQIAIAAAVATLVAVVLGLGTYRRPRANASG